MTLLSIIIPVHNEAKTLGDVIDLILQVKLTGITYELIVIDDGSNDGSTELIENIGLEYSPLAKIIKHNIQLGKGAAIKSALKEADGDIILIQDADLEYRPSDYPLMLEPIITGKCDVVYGSRFSGSRNCNIPVQTCLANLILCLMFKILYKSNLTDIATAYKVFRRDVLQGLDIRANGYEVCSEITAKLLNNKQEIIEVPVSYVPRSRAQGKKINYFLDGLKFIITLIKWWLPIKYPFRRLSITVKN